MNPVRITKQTVTMENYTQDPLNPHAPFPQWSPFAVYPYQFWGSMRKYVVKQDYLMYALENDFLRVTIGADIGGRVWDVYDKIGGRHLANYNIGVRTYNAGHGLNYTTGGIEVNYPLAHSVTTSRPREVSTARYEDGSAAIIASEYDRIWRTRWSVAYVLRPDRSALELRVRIYNRTAFDSRYQYWCNCGFVLNESSQFLLPEDAGSQHGKEDRTFSWPLWQHRDMSLWPNVPQMLGLYMLDATEPYFGYYDHREQFGLVHYGDLADLPGKKYWTWGAEAPMVEVYRKTHHTLNEVYGEVQSGRIVIQEHRDRVPPETESVWSEIWYPVRGTGAFNGAGAGAAMRAEVVESGEKRSRLKICAHGNGFFPAARVVVCSDGLAAVERPMPLAPKAPTERVVTLNGPAGPDRHTVIVLRDKDGLILASCRLRHPNRRDCWREVVEVHESAPPTTAEELFQAAESKARDWGNYDLKPLYEKALRQDENFSPARLELGKLALGQGLYDEAVRHFDAGLKRASDSLELRYYRGLALAHAGRTAQARQMFELANRYDWEARSLVRLAELRMREGDWHHALLHLDRVAAAFPRLTRPRGLRAICLRKLGRRTDAAAEIAAALAVDGQDPFLQIEAMIGRAGGPAKKLPAPAVKALVEQVRGDEQPLLEAAFDYLSVGLHEEAAAALRLAPKPGPVTTLAQAWVAEQLGRDAEAMKLLRAACRLDPVGCQPWHLELVPMLAWARGRLPQEPRLALYLGDLFMGRRRTDEAVRLWQEAESLGEKHDLLFANLAFYYSRAAKDAAQAEAYFRKAVEAGPDDLYVKHELFNALSHRGKRPEAVKYLEGEDKAVLLSPVLTNDLCSHYLEQRDYAKFDALCARVDFTPNWGLEGPHNLWVKRQIMEAIDLRMKGRLREALRMLEDLRPAPAHLGVQGHKVFEEDRRWYQMGCIHEALGDREAARRCWEPALSFEHGMWWEPGYWPRLWTQRYFQALALQKLGRTAEANSYFDAMEMAAQNAELSLGARKALMALVERGRFAPDAQKDPIWQPTVKEKTRAEE